MRMMKYIGAVLVILFFASVVSACSNNKAGKQTAVAKDELTEKEFIQDKLDMEQETVKDLESLKPEFALNFLHDYLNRPIGDAGYRVDVMKWLEQSNATTSSFRENLDSLLSQAEVDDPELGLGYDPLIMGQDYAEKYEIDYYDATKDAFVFKGMKPDDQFTTAIKVVELDGQLLVDGFGLIGIEGMELK